MPAPPSVIRSPLFPLLSEHLEDNPVWNQWNTLSHNLAKLSLRAWLAAYQLTNYAVGWLQSPDDSPLQTSDKSRATTDQQVSDGLRRLAGDPAYRDGFGKVLKPMVYLLGTELLRKGLQESEIGPEARAIGFVLGLYILQVEDNLQRVEKPQWLSPTGEQIREVVEHLWQEASSKEVISPLGKEDMLDLIRLWQQWMDGCQGRDGASPGKLDSARAFPGGLFGLPEQIDRLD